MKILLYRCSLVAGYTFDENENVDDLDMLCACIYLLLFCYQLYPHSCMYIAVMYK